MIRARIATLAAPIFLFVALLLGGSTRGIWGNMALQLLGIAFLAWAALRPEPGQLPPAAKTLKWIVVAGLIVVLLQLVPLPAGVWTQLPGRDPMTQGYAMLGEKLPRLPLSLEPYGTLASSLALLPPIALGSLVLLKVQKDSWIAAALIAGTCLGVLLGALQISSGGPGRSSLYLYEITNSGAVGFFANKNHMGTLLLASLPFAFALLGGARRGRGRGLGVSSGPVAAITLLLLIGIVLNGSIAVLLLAVPVLVFSLLLLPLKQGWRRPMAAVAVLTMLVAMLALIVSPLSSDSAGIGQASFQSRIQIWQSGLEVARQVFPFGSGLGSFEAIFHLAEDASQTTRIYVNHAHNDYLELVIELGVPGAILVTAFLLWWARQLAVAWARGDSSRFARAASIASAAILAQSLVDYPVRTAAIACLLGVCAAFMARPVRTGDAKGVNDLRHVVIE